MPASAQEQRDEQARQARIAQQRAAAQARNEASNAAARQTTASTGQTAQIASNTARIRSLSSTPGAPATAETRRITTPGYALSTVGDSLTLERRPELAGALSSIQAGRLAEADRLKALLPSVEPGMGRLTEASLAALESRRRRAIGNLQENLAQRRIAGSSFAGDITARAEREFGEEEQKIRAESFMQELALKTEIINQEATARIKAYTEYLTQSNFEAELGTRVSTGIANIMAENARWEAQMEAQEASDRGGLLGTIIGGGIGYAVGGPAGAQAGAQIGGAAGRGA